MADHAIVWLEEQSQTDTSTSQCIDQLKDGMKSHFPGSGENLLAFDDLNSCCQHIKDNSQKQAIFLVTSDSLADSILTHFRETQNFIHSLYVLTASGTKYVDVLNGYGSQGILVKIVDVCESLPIRILHDISKYYFSKGVHEEKDGTAAAARDALSYFDFAKKAEGWAKEVTEVVHRGYLSEIDNHISQAKDTITRGQCSDDGTMILWQQEVSASDEDSYGTVRTFIVGLERISIQLDSDIARLIPCTSDDELILIASALQQSTPILVVSSGPLSANVATLPELLHHYTLLSGASLSRYPSVDDEHKSNVYSEDHLMAELYDKLGQHYQDCSIRASVESNDHRVAKDLLEKSARCYELLECATKKTLKRYGDILKKNAL